MRSTSPTRRRTPRCGRRWSASCAPGRCRPVGVKRPDEATYHARDRRAGDRARSRRGRAPESRPPADPSPEPRRVRQRHPGPARARHRRRDVAPACRRFRRTASTTSPTCWACRRCCRSATSPPPIASAGWPWAIPRRRRGSDTFRLRQDLSQDQHIEGLPLGTVGGLAVNYTFPLDGEYTFNVKLFRNNQGATRGLDYEHQLEIAVDGERVHLAAFGGRAELEKSTDENVIPTSDDVDARLRVRVPVKAGPRLVTIAFLEKPPVQDTKRLEPFLRSSFGPQDHTGYPHIETCHHLGSVQRDRPRRHAEPAAPVRVPPDQPRPSEEDVRTQIIDDDRAPGLPPSHPVGRARAARCVLPVRRRPRALRAAHPADAAADPGQPEVRLPRRARSRRRPRSAPPTASATWNWRRASRSSSGAAIPDDELLDAGQPGQAARSRPCSRRRSAACWPTRKAEALVKNFAGQWLQLRNLQNVVPDPRGVPELRRQPAPRVRAGDRDALRQHHARGPQRDRPAERGLHVRQRAAGPALQDSERLRQPFPAGAGEGRCPARHPGPGQHADGDVARGDARRRCCAASGSWRTSVRDAPAAAPARRAGARGEGRVGAAVDARSRWRSIAPTRRARSATS